MAAIGQIERGFDFLCYHFSRQLLRLAAVTVERFMARYHRLDEVQQRAPDKGAAMITLSAGGGCQAGRAKSGPTPYVGNDARDRLDRKP